MSRAYRIRVRESLQRLIRGSDRVGTELELLAILPADQLAHLLAAELERQGFLRDGDRHVREFEGVRVEIDAATGQVEVISETQDDLKLSDERRERVYDRRTASRELREQMRKELEQQADQRETELQQQATDRLEKSLRDLRPLLDRAVNRVTAEALKIKAAQLGEIREMVEDDESGSLTIVLEV